jgi:hypothetical protein
MNTSPLVEELDREGLEIQSHQQIRLWPELRITEQRQLARHWARLIQQIRHTRSEKDTETNTHET